MFIMLINLCNFPAQFQKIQRKSIYLRYSFSNFLAIGCILKSNFLIYYQFLYNLKLNSFFLKVVLLLEKLSFNIY